jgi:hypothetical protein
VHYIIVTLQSGISLKSGLYPAPVIRPKGQMQGHGVTITTDQAETMPVDGAEISLFISDHKD